MIEKEEDSGLAASVWLIYPGHLPSVHKLWAPVQNILTLHTHNNKLIITSDTTETVDVFMSQYAALQSYMMPVVQVARQ